MGSTIAPLGMAVAALFGGCLFISILLLRKLPLRLCVPESAESRVAFVAIGRVGIEGVKCFENPREALSSGVEELSDAVAMVLAVRKVFLSIAMLAGLGLALSIAITALALALGA